jgi:dethiobiotin synthetase
MAADALGRAGFTVAELVAELVWPEPRIEVGLVETAGGVCSPQADDGDAVTLARALSPDVVLLVADAGLGAINSIRLSIRALVPGAVPSGARPSGARLSDVPLIVLLNRFDPGNDLHRRNRAWLVERDGFTVLVLPGDESALADLARSDGSSRGRVTPL